MSYLAAILVLALLIFVHELGHFMAARLQGIYANRFSIGFGPILLKYQGPQTEYALRAIPLGGFVGFPDDEPDNGIDPTDPNLMRNRPILDRAIVISAGVIANLIFAYAVLVGQIGIFGIPNLNYQPGVEVSQVVAANSPAAQAGVEPGDIILKVNNATLPGQEGVVQTLVGTIKTSADKPLDFLVQRGGQRLNLTVTPKRLANGEGQVGLQLSPNGELTYRRSSNPVEVLTLAANEFQELVSRVVGGFQLLLTNFRETAAEVAGPVGIVKFGGDAAQAGSGNLFFFAAFVSINLAVINILPLPALDGGQLVFLLFEALRGKPLPERLQESVMQTGLMLLLGLGIFLILRDTAQLNWVKQIFQQ
ncbi:MAG: RIP metalloprotease RseP [Cyanobacteria bacterium P01_H01_bin.121]